MLTIVFDLGKARLYLCAKGACKYYISTLGGDGGSERNAYFAYGVRRGWGS